MSMRFYVIAADTPKPLQLRLNGGQPVTAYVGTYDATQFCGLDVADFLDEANGVLAPEPEPTPAAETPEIGSQPDAGSDYTPPVALAPDPDEIDAEGVLEDPDAWRSQFA